VSTLESETASDRASELALPAPERPGHAGALVLGAIVALAIVLRIAGIGFLLPHQAEPDGNVIATQVELLRSGAAHPEREFLFGFYPTLIARVASILPASSASNRSARSATDDGTKSATSERASAPSTLEGQLADASTEYLRIRLVVALLSVLIVPATWLLARRFMGPGAASCAALLVAASVLHLWFAQQARPHAASAAFALLGVLAAVNLRRRGRAIDFVAGGLGLGLAIGSLQSGVAVALPLALAVVLRTRAREARSRWWGVASIALALAFVPLFYPYFFAPSRAPSGVRFAIDAKHMNLWGHPIVFEQFDGEGFGVVWNALAGYEPWITALAIVGAAIAITRIVLQRAPRDVERTKDLAVVLAYAVPYLVAIGLYARTYQRFVIPLVPYLACLAAYAIVCIATWIGRRKTRVTACAALVLLAPQVAGAFALVSIRRARDTATLAAEWVSEHVKPASKRMLMQYPLELPLPSTSAALAAETDMIGDVKHPDLKHPWHLYECSLDDSARLLPAWNMVQMPLASAAQRDELVRDARSYLASLHGDYAAIDVYDGGRRPRFLNLIPPALKELGVRVARFSPDSVDDGCNLPLTYQDDEYPVAAPWFWRVLHARCTGPVIEIYELR
jgi:hypothetical protein